MATNPSYPRGAVKAGNTVSGFLGPDGRPMSRAAQGAVNDNSGGNGGGDVVIDVAGLKKNVSFLNWVAAAGVVALISLYFILSGQVDARFDKADERVQKLSEQVSDVRVLIAGQSADTKAILEKLDAKSQSTPSRPEAAKP